MCPDLTCPEPECMSGNHPDREWVSGCGYGLMYPDFVRVLSRCLDVGVGAGVGLNVRILSGVWVWACVSGS